MFVQVIPSCDTEQRPPGHTSLRAEGIGAPGAVLGRSSPEVPFSLVLFSVAQAPSEGPSRGQEMLSDVPLSGQSQRCLCLKCWIHTAALHFSCFCPCIFLPVRCAASQPGSCCCCGGCGTMPVPSLCSLQQYPAQNPPSGIWDCASIQLSRAALGSFSVALRWLSLFQTKQQTGGKKRGKNINSVPPYQQGYKEGKCVPFCGAREACFSLILSVWKCFE